MNWAIASLAIVALALAAQAFAFERSRPEPRMLALIGVLAALAVAGRLAFAPIPNVKPTTDIILIAGFALGAAPGFAVGSITALVSNMAFGQGPWTPWQMLAWGLVGLIGAALARVCNGSIGRLGLAAVCAGCGLLFGAVMDVSQWLLYGGDPELAKLAGFAATSLPWNIAHAAGNAAFALAFGPMLLAATVRAKARLEPRWLPVGVRLESVSLPALAVVAGLGLSGQPGDRIDAPVGHRVSARAAAASPAAWLASAQNADGGFGVDRGGSSAPMYTAWSAIGLAASGRDLNGVARQGGLSVVERLMVDARQANEPGEEQRLVIAAVAAGADPGSFGGRNLVARVASRVSSAGSVSAPGSGPAINLTAFAIIALSAADREPSAVSRAASWLRRQANSDGGFGPFPDTASDVDDTAAVIQALAAAERLDATTSARGFRFIAKATAANGGVRTAPPVGLPENSQSTAWAAQAMIATGRSPARQLAWLRGRIGSSGKIAYAPGSFQTPVWVTAQALVAISGRSLPLDPPAQPSLEPDSSSSAGSTTGVDGGVDEGSTVDPAVAARDAKRDRAIARGRRIERGRRVAMSTAVTVGIVVGAFVRAFGGGNR